MKKVRSFAILSFVMVFMGLAAAHASCCSEDKQSAGIENGIEPIPLKGIDADILHGIMEGKMPHLSLQVCEGVAVPLKLFLKGDVLGLVEESETSKTLVCKIPFYIRNVGGQLLGSWDNVEWKALQDLLLGSVFMAIGLDDNREAVITVGAEIYLKHHVF